MSIPVEKPRHGEEAGQPHSKGSQGEQPALHPGHSGYRSPLEAVNSPSLSLSSAFHCCVPVCLHKPLGRPSSVTGDFLFSSKDGNTEYKRPNFANWCG